MNGVGGGASTGARQRNLPTAPLLPGTLSIGGTGFGRVTYTSKGRLGGTSCVSTIWVAETQVTCGGARGVVEANTSAAVLLTVAWRWNTLLLGFSFDGPAVSMVLHYSRAIGFLRTGRRAFVGKFLNLGGCMQRRVPGVAYATARGLKQIAANRGAGCREIRMQPCLIGSAESFHARTNSINSGGCSPPPDLCSPSFFARRRFQWYNRGPLTPSKGSQITRSPFVVGTRRNGHAS